MEKEKRNGPTNAGTCTSVVWAHRGADRKALPPKNIIITYTMFEQQARVTLRPDRFAIFLLDM